MNPQSLIYERDVEVTVRDGAVLRANVYRLTHGRPAPVLMTFGPYGKDFSMAAKNLDYFNELGGGAFLNWETPEPEYWVARDYTVLRVDSRGSGTSPGKMDVFSRTQAQDYYDAIEWAAEQPWSTGKVGLLGVSYYAMSQWAVAALQPPHLTAMMPWEGASDTYRDFQRHAGILNDFLKFWSLNMIGAQYGRGGADPELPEEARAENRISPVEQAKAHPLDDETYTEWLPDLATIKVPFVSVGNWGNLMLHLRGNTEAYMRAASAQKWLRIIVGDHFLPFYSPSALAMQERFFGHFLKGEDTGWAEEPRVQLAIRRGEQVEQRDETEWPLPDTLWTSYYLDAATASVGPDKPDTAGKLSYAAPEGFVSFGTPPLEQELEITGPVALRLWVSATARDMDIYVLLHNLDPDGHDCWGISPNGGKSPLAQGWLRVSQRKLDPVLSRPYRPYLAHDEAWLLTPDEIVPVDIEIWPTSIVLERGHRLVVDIGAGNPPQGTFKLGSDDRISEGVGATNTVYTGPEHPSQLLLPVIPKRPG